MRRWSADYFENVMTKFIVNNKTDALKTDVDLLICNKILGIYSCRPCLWNVILSNTKLAGSTDMASFTRSAKCFYFFPQWIMHWLHYLHCYQFLGFNNVWLHIIQLKSRHLLLKKLEFREYNWKHHFQSIINNWW